MYKNYHVQKLNVHKLIVHDDELEFMLNPFPTPL
jgi:hypothetical protein